VIVIDRRRNAGYDGRTSRVHRLILPQLLY
jgi:hypothetical protein